ncbi:ER membrane protein complex subunit 5 [Patella vulgata]|uniref:Membrane magnesium transporter n=1 Tax=Patella caerulea TaxID=87958 RepID=A0AAN8Q2R5_PATCE|nr:ER membrane protein complex subunit 5 [Patella vulgata]
MTQEMAFIHKLCVSVGLIALAHAAYSATQHHAYLRLTEQEFAWLPLDIILQCLFGLSITYYGIINIAGQFKSIKASAEMETKTWEMLSNRQSFYTFHHRGKALYGDRERVELE